ncbi:DUF2326 domain-containing protein [Clostridium sporogenes]|uniref:DUF2326 domain-containing protein n=1 Tax=Clostridium sporogenes TaxID=1509 RepID=UPI0013D0E7ED|nr:DUF2326 domain-containing protein [Clostridium sporogenes]NFD92795.1 DUF2326 domain-containing protein [Clostridium sporogenes]NFE44096.1 DUF2326 domain-containing protein [Clostridium sporogenes]NFF14839.1 DUF2326 domain-containing protein [Clostridium sporogenes]NFF73493.1 DUF2326 domain-containing protein [Clostridium sporogenes]NFF93407.1 DUF2326 domain-containing protein [Clostridium sporogenes]
MLFEELVIYSCKDNIILKEYKFNKNGVSIILGEKNRERLEGDSNGVGKTTFVEILRCLLGQKIKKTIVNSKEINDNKIFTYLKCKMDRKTVYLGKKLYEQNGYILYSNKVTYELHKWEFFEEDKYREKVEKLMISNSESVYNIKLSSINEYLIRDSIEGFIDLIRPKRHADVSAACLAYLCGLPYWLEMEINKIKTKINKLKIKKQYISSLNDEIADIKIEKKKLQIEVEELNESIANLKMIDSISLYEEHYKIAREQYAELEKIKLKKERQCKQYRKNIKSLEQNKYNSEKLVQLEDFYKQILKYFPENLTKSYKEVVEFYDFMDKNRSYIYTQNIEKLMIEIGELKLKIKNLRNTMESYSKMINNKEFSEDYNYLISILNEKHKLLSDAEYKIEVYDSQRNINKEINKYKAEILENNNKFQKLFDQYEELINMISSDFEKMVEISYNQQGELIFEYNNSVDGRSNTGRIKIHSKIPDEESHGIKIMKIVMFDLACLFSRIRNDDKIKFLIHDGAMTLPDNKLAKMNLIEHVDKKLKEMKVGQYIITTNVSDFTDKQIKKFYKDNYVIKALDKNKDENRCLGIKFVT